MRIAVHAKVLSETRPVGIGIYTYNVLKAISKLDYKNEYVLYSNEPIVQKIEASNFKEKLINFPGGWTYLRFPFEFIDNKYDLLFMPKEVVPPFKRPKTVIVCYDLGLIRDPKERVPLSARLHYLISVNYAFKVADRIIAISEATKKDLVEKCKINPEKITVTHLGYDEGLYKQSSDANLIKKVKEKYGISKNYFINTSSLLWHRKNVTGLIKAFNLVKPKGGGLQLVITGKKGESYEEVESLISSLGLQKDVILTSYIPVEEMPVLLSGAEALVFPSFYEGFGLPLVEAMACGCPIITSNISSLPEVAGDAGILVDPYNTQQIADAMGKVLTDPDFSEKMRQKGLIRAKNFSWEKTARLTLDVFEKLL